jgi:hypothetical protein
VPSASRGSIGLSRGEAHSAIFPNVITAPGSPPGNQPPSVNTIVQAFSKQRIAKEKKDQKAELLADTRRRVISFLAVPTAFHDPLRTLSVEQLSGLTNTDLIANALMVFTTDNVDGSLRLADGSSVSMFQCINEFASHSTTRDAASIKRRLREKLSTLRAIADVERYTAVHDEDDIDPFLEDSVSDDGFLDFTDEQPSSIKRKIHTTLAGATVGKKQVRHANKRQHKPTNRFGDNVAVKDRHVVYATESRSLQRNRQLLMLPGSKLNASGPPIFPGNVNMLLFLRCRRLQVTLRLSLWGLRTLNSQVSLKVFTNRMPQLRLQCLQLLSQQVAEGLGMTQMTVAAIHQTQRLVIMARTKINLDLPQCAVIMTMTM